MPIFEFTGEHLPQIRILDEEGRIHPLYPGTYQVYRDWIDTAGMAFRYNLPENLLAKSIRAHPEYGLTIFEVTPVQAPADPIQEEPKEPIEVAAQQDLTSPAPGPDEEQAGDVVDAVLGEDSSPPADEAPSATEGEASQPASPFICPVCSKPCKNGAGLHSHMRSHAADPSENPAPA